VAMSCSQIGQDNLKGYIEYGLESRNYLRWTKEQPITWDLFAGDINGTGLYYNYYGIYFFWVKEEKLRFNATVYFDKEKSWVKPKDEWGESAEYYEQMPTVLKLKFDYYEFIARQLRKHLIDNGNSIRDEDMRSLIERYYDKAKREWEVIQTQLFEEFSESKLQEIRSSIDSDLNGLKKYDSSLNSVFN
jgi:hypothetical protein